MTQIRIEKDEKEIYNFYIHWKVELPTNNLKRREGTKWG
jgi:hypothetical protein